MMALAFVVVTCFLLQNANANPTSDETIQALLERLDKLEKLNQQHQLEIQTLQEKSIKQEEVNGMQEKRILEIETTIKVSQWNESDFATCIQKRGGM